ncbi:MAG: hypothetical protein WCK17_12430 [Verrucomicrobiota bacterium]
MLFPALESLLSQLERLCSGNSRHHSPPGLGKAIYSGNDNVQYFGLDDSDSFGMSQNLPVVPVIGINYSQCDPNNPNKQLLPHSGHHAGPPYVVDNWSGQRRRLRLCFDHYLKYPQIWVDNFLASSSALPVPNNCSYHLAATNFSGWITNVEWAKLETHVGRGVTNELLLNQPHGLPKTFDHVAHLAQKLQADHAPLWVAHGLGNEVGILARLFFIKHEITNWMLVPNLSNWRGRIRVSNNGVLKFG